MASTTSRSRQPSARRSWLISRGCAATTTRKRSVAILRASSSGRTASCVLVGVSPRRSCAIEGDPFFGGAIPFRPSDGTAQQEKESVRSHNSPGTRACSQDVLLPFCFHEDPAWKQPRKGLRDFV